MEKYGRPHGGGVWCLLGSWRPRGHDFLLRVGQNNFGSFVRALHDRRLCRCSVWCASGGVDACAWPCVCRRGGVELTLLAKENNHSHHCAGRWKAGASISRDHPPRWSFAGLEPEAQQGRRASAAHSQPHWPHGAHLPGTPTNNLPVKERISQTTE